MNTAAILFLATVIEKFKPPDPGNRATVVFGFAAFVISLTVAFIAMVVLSSRIGSTKDPNQHWNDLESMQALEILGFLSGIAAVAKHVIF
ncbi:MAG TPA: hypothetical protein VG826_23880 [Pirellulales bacterium]|nr:hypothetical protein [Pirellulales bacterium]